MLIERFLKESSDKHYGLAEVALNLSRTKYISLLFGVFLASMGGLMLELMLTRFGSVLMYYHFAFLSISLALLGTSIGGIGVYVLANRFPKERALIQASLFALLLATATVGALTVVLSIPLSPSISLETLQTAQGIGFLAAVLSMGVPFIFLGFCLAIVLKHFSADISRVYFVDLVGAAAGCLFLIPVLGVLDGIAAVMLIAFVFALAALLFAWAASHTAYQMAAIAACVLIGGFGLYNSHSDALRIRYSKGLAEVPPLLERWNSLSRIAVFPPNRSARGDATALAESASGLDRMLIDIDAGASTVMTRFDGDFSKVEALKSEVASVVYRLTPKRNVLIIGAGGGNDVLTALAFGSEAVTAVEMNPLMFEVATHFEEFNGGIFEHPAVTTVVDEARSYISHTPQQFDVIQATLVDTWAASAAGAFALTENYLYTQEAFAHYWDHLTDEGIFTMTRFYIENDPKELLRLLALPLAVMDQKGVVQPHDHLVVVKREFLATILWKKSPFTADELRIIDEANAAYWFPIIYTPYNAADPVISEFITSPDREAFFDAYASNVRAPTDNQPFFFFFNKTNNSSPIQALRNMLSGTDEPSALLASLFVLLSTLTILFIFLPLLLFDRAAAFARPGLFAELFLYFAALGVGFIVVEIVLIQRFILFLGHPIYATTVILFSLLLFGGAGSYLTRSLSRRSWFSRTRAILLLLVLLLIYNWGLPRFIEHFIQLPSMARIVVTVLLICPLGLLMGMPFPLGIMRVDQVASSLIPWVWGINGAFSVIGSVLAALLSIQYGFATAMAMGTAVYAVALLVSLRPARA